ncbi:MAG: hypothetical protein LBQ57_06980 [Spirochaetales bacterium]|nr:hypothetical protein [Spirochaetales bacterium]
MEDNKVSVDGKNFAGIGKLIFNTTGVSIGFTFNHEKHEMHEKKNCVNKPEAVWQFLPQFPARLAAGALSRKCAGRA